MINMKDISVFQQFGKGAPAIQITGGTNSVIYTRVSSKEQADRNLSLETQRKACDQYAEKHKHTVLAYFGGTYESAQTDERKEFASMIAYVKNSRKKISNIIVYSLERFSRNDNSIWLSGQLRKLGVEIISVTQPIDTSNPAGKMQQKMLFLFGEFDNELRKQKCMAGIREMLLRGDWPTKPPMGFDSVKRNGARKIVVNQKGKLLRQAFLWKAQEEISIIEICKRLKEKGFTINHRRISEIFRNPFYCGLMIHNMLEGKVVEGNHEVLVSQELFLKVNGIMDRKTNGYSIKEENDEIPLKRFLLCNSCGKSMRGYIVKSKKLYYYKCCTIGCKNNRSAKWLNGHFKKILGYFNLSAEPGLTKLIREQTVATFNNFQVNREKNGKC
ncbi:hypothetical protein EL17_00935 [Anditalea andensis]|uniref:Resolvase n=2 Tax=Anditalea andensis TaxID=1048983 RepID=A0A074LNE7_9BACT|nr:hypothetical protein EL17_00935 [Anditalea andensis]